MLPQRIFIGLPAILAKREKQIHRFRKAPFGLGFTGVPQTLFPPLHRRGRQKFEDPQAEPGILEFFTEILKCLGYSLDSVVNK